MRRNFDLVAGLTCVIIGVMLFFLSSICTNHQQAGMVALAGVGAFGFGLIKLHIYYEHNDK